MEGKPDTPSPTLGDKPPPKETANPSPRTDDDDLCGLLCVPSGMSAQQVNDFNSVFCSLSRTEQSAFFQDLADLARLKGIPVIDIDADLAKAKTPK